MKALISSFFALVISLFCPPAQFSVEHELTGIEVSVKRCFKQNNTVFVDVVFSNTTKKDCHMTLWKPTAVDDEGVSYRQNDTYWEVEPQSKFINCVVQSGITKRYRMAIKNPDEFAVSFQLVDFQCDWDGCGRFQYGMWRITKIRLKNLPITVVE